MIAVITTLTGKKLSSNDKNSFSNRMTQELDKVLVPSAIFHGPNLCYNNDHVIEIEKYYCDILNAIATADAVLPRCKPGMKKHFWSEELDRLKADSFNAFKLWEDVGRPRHGPDFLFFEV